MNRDETILRPLAYAYLNICMDEKNARNAALHRAVNDLKPVRPVVLIDEVPYHELNVDGSLTLQCEDPVLRETEEYLRKTLFHWRHFPADMVVYPFVPVQKIMRSTGIGLEVREEVLVLDGANPIVSHEYRDQLQNERDLERLHPPVITYDQEETLRRLEKVGEAIGDIVPVRLLGHNHCVSIWDDIARYRGVNNLLIDLAERPEFMHQIASALASFKKSESEQMEALGLFELAPCDIHCTCAAAGGLPSPGFDGVRVTRRDVWGRGMAQIFSAVSKAMHDEFDIAYMKELFEPFGLTYYGCCEPLDKKIDILEKLPHLRKISITPWADVEVAAEAIGKKYVLANKPNPSAVATTLDEDALRRELGKTLAACQRYGCSCDIVLKDISSVGYKLENLTRWEQIAMELVGAR